MRLFLTALILSCCLCKSYSQQKLPSFTKNQPSNYDKSPLFIVTFPDKDTIICRNADLMLTLKLDLLESVQVLKDAKASEKMESSIPNGEILIAYKENIKRKKDIVTLESITKNLPSDLPIYLDSNYVKYPEVVYFNKKEIKSATVNTEKTTGIKFINVLTYDDRYKFNPLKPKPGEILLR